MLYINNNADIGSRIYVIADHPGLIMKLHNHIVMFWEGVMK